MTHNGCYWSSPPQKKDDPPPQKKKKKKNQQNPDIDNAGLRSPHQSLFFKCGEK